MDNLKKTSLLFIILVSSFSVIAQTFNITGTTTGVAEGTWLYLRTSSPEKTLDSTKVMNGKFSLIGKADEKICQMIIYTAKYENYVFFWAEQNTHLQLKNGEFKKALITGSKTQAQANLRNKLKELNQKLQDSLSQLLTIQKDDAVKKELKEKLIAAKNAERELDIKDVKDNPNSIISAYVLSVYAATWGKEKATALYENLSSEMKNTSYGKNIKNFISLNKDVKIGDQYVDFEQLNANGKMVKLSDIKGKYILLDFWASWCGPCREENPNLVKTYAAFKDKGFNIIGVSADDNKEFWLKAIKDDQLSWENVSDLKGDKNRAALIYGINAYPTNFLIDQNGKIIAKNLRGENLNKKLQELLP